MMIKQSQTEMSRRIGNLPGGAPGKLRFARKGTAALLLLLATFAHSQNSQFTFDGTGNLVVQIAEINELPQILGQPQNQVVTPGNSASFSAVVADTRNVSYQWRYNGENINGANSDALLITNVSTNNEGTYSVVVANGSGSVTSAPAALMIDSRGCGMPDSWQLAYFGNLSQNATGDFDGDGVSNLREFLDGTNPTNAASALYRINLAQDGGTVVVTPSQPSYTNGQVVTLTAVGNATVPFHAWTGDLTTRSNSITIAMTNNWNLFAHFLPFTLTWTNVASGDWRVATNWTPNLAPSTNESVLIVTPVTVTLNSDVTLLDFTLGTGNVESGLIGSGRLTFAGTGVWSSGTMGGTGATVVAPGASFTINNTITVTLAGRTLENGGTAVWPGGYMSVNGGAITNDAGASFQIQSPASFNYGSGSPRFDNAGTIECTGATTTAFEGVAFNNYGNVNIVDGTLLLGGGGVHAGTETVPAGTTINFASGTFNSSGSPSITGAGTFQVSGGTANLGGIVNVTGSNVFTGGTANLTGNYTCVDSTPLNIAGGTVNFDGSGTVAPQVLNLNGVLGGANTVKVGSVMNWTGGTMDGSGQTIIGPAATLRIAGFAGYGGVTIVSRTLENSGTVVWGGGNFGMNSCIITNDAGASFQIQGAAAFNYQGGSSRFDNTGTFLAAPGGTTGFYSVVFNNYGALNLANGSLLSLGGGGVQWGPVTVPTGATLDYAGGTFNASAGSSITGAGTLQVSAGTANLTGVVNVTGTNLFTGGTANLIGNYTCVGSTLLNIAGGAANFDGSGTVAPQVLNLNGVLGGANTVKVGSAMNWTGGTMDGSGQTIIGPSATLSIAAFAGYGGVTIVSRTLENSGTVVWGGGNFGMNSCIITNDVGASFQIQGAAAFNYQGGSSRFDNTGTFLPSPTGTTAFYSVAFNNYGTLNLGVGGLFLLEGGYLGASNSIVNYAIDGKSPGTNFTQIQTPNAITLNGTLNVNLTNHYIPTTNDSFTLVSAETRNGAFSNFTYPSNNVSMVLSNTATSVIVRVTSVALQQTTLSAPAGTISWWRAESNALDSIGTNNGALTNGASYAAGEVGQSFLLDGTSGYVVIPDSPSLEPVSVTVEAWVKIFSTNGTQLIFAKPLGAGTFDSYGLALANGAPLAAICDTSGFGTFLSITNTLTLGQWYHLAYTYDGTSGQQALYVNGAAVASGNAGKSMSYDAHPLLLGADIENGVPSYFLDGQIDEATIYNRALGPNEIASIYNVGSFGKELPFELTLYMERIAPTSARLYWSTNYPLYHLQYNTSIGTTNWAATGLVPVVTGANFVVTNSLFGAQGFYRLSQ